MSPSDVASIYASTANVVGIILALAGLGSGLYYVPLAAFMQARPPQGEKGVCWQWNPL